MVILGGIIPADGSVLKNMHPKLRLFEQVQNSLKRSLTVWVGGAYIPLTNDSGTAAGAGELRLCGMDVPEGVSGLDEFSASRASDPRRAEADAMQPGTPACLIFDN